MSKATSILTVRVPRQEIEQLEALATERGYSLSELVRIVLRRVSRGVYRVAAKDTEAAA